MTIELPKDPAALAALTELLRARADAVAWRNCRINCDGLPHEGVEYPHARSKQRPPWGQTLSDGSPVRRWYLRGGRGSGKTWAGANALAEVILWHGGVDANGDRREYGIIGPTYKYTKETLLEGGSGLIKALGGESGPNISSYNRSTGTLVLTNGAIVYTAGADNFGQGIEGKNLTAVWCDEVGLWSLRRWKYTWEQAIQFAVRKDPSLFIFTGTPKEGHPFVKELISDKRVVTSTMSTMENKGLPSDVLKDLEQKYAGTRIGRQELYGELLTDTPGALWTSALIENARLATPPPLDDMVRVVVGWDPAVSSKETSDEHGIVVAAQIGGDPASYVVLEDCSGRYTPLEAVRVVAEAYNRWGANTVVAETNNGGDMVEALLRTGTTTNIDITKVNASRGKRLRAEPIAALSEQGRLLFNGIFPKLEDQLTTWTPAAPGSPDRLDAMVWAITALTEKSNTSRAYWGGSKISVRGK
jgi:phage terminase large subunit-like protein